MELELAAVDPAADRADDVAAAAAARGEAADAAREHRHGAQPEQHGERGEQQVGVAVAGGVGGGGALDLQQRRGCGRIADRCDVADAESLAVARGPRGCTIARQEPDGGDTALGARLSDRLLQRAPGAPGSARALLTLLVDAEQPGDQALERGDVAVGLPLGVGSSAVARPGVDEGADQPDNDHEGEAGERGGPARTPRTVLGGDSGASGRVGGRMSARRRMRRRAVCSRSGAHTLAIGRSEARLYINPTAVPTPSRAAASREELERLLEADQGEQPHDLRRAPTIARRPPPTRIRACQSARMPMLRESRKLAPERSTITSPAGSSPAAAAASAARDSSLAVGVDIASDLDQKPPGSSITARIEWTRDPLSPENHPASRSWTQAMSWPDEKPTMRFRAPLFAARIALCLVSPPSGRRMPIRSPRSATLASPGAPNVDVPAVPQVAASRTPACSRSTGSLTPSTTRSRASTDTANDVTGGLGGRPRATSGDAAADP